MQKRATCVQCGRKRNSKYLMIVAGKWECKDCNQVVKGDRGYQGEKEKPKNQLGLW